MIAGGMDDLDDFFPCGLCGPGAPRAVSGDGRVYCGTPGCGCYLGLTAPGGE